MNRLQALLHVASPKACNAQQLERGMQQPAQPQCNPDPTFSIKKLVSSGATARNSYATDRLHRVLREVQRAERMQQPVPIDIEALISELHPIFGWEADELELLRRWAKEDPETTRAQLREHRDFAQNPGVAGDCDRLIDEAAGLGLDADVIAMRAERRWAAPIALLGTRDDLRRYIATLRRRGGCRR